jgi:hypothetical protein
VVLHCESIKPVDGWWIARRESELAPLPGVPWAAKGDRFLNQKGRRRGDYRGKMRLSGDGFR